MDRVFDFVQRSVVVSAISDTRSDVVVGGPTRFARSGGEGIRRSAIVVRSSECVEGIARNESGENIIRTGMKQYDAISDSLHILPHGNTKVTPFRTYE